MRAPLSSSLWLALVVTLLVVSGIAFVLSPWNAGQRGTTVAASTRSRHSAGRQTALEPGVVGGASGGASAPIGIRQFSAKGEAAGSSWLPEPRVQDRPDRVEGSTQVVPHPLDAERRLIAALHRLFLEVDTAIHAADFAGARVLLADAAKRVRDEPAWADKQEGYQRIVDCLQFPSEQTEALGREFVEQRRGSTLRRSVRRACKVTN